MKRRSFLLELEDFAPSNKLVPDKLDTQGRHAFAAVEKLFKQIAKDCDEETVADLKKRFINSLKGDMDYRKFERGIESLRRKSNEDTL